MIRVISVLVAIIRAEYVIFNKVQNSYFQFHCLKFSASWSMLREISNNLSFHKIVRQNRFTPIKYHFAKELKFQYE